jgi:hypothetical protein
LPGAGGGRRADYGRGLKIHSTFTIRQTSRSVSIATTLRSSIGRILVLVSVRRSIKVRHERPCESIIFIRQTGPDQVGRLCLTPRGPPGVPAYANTAPRYLDRRHYPKWLCFIWDTFYRGFVCFQGAKQGLLNPPPQKHHT